MVNEVTKRKRNKVDILLLHPEEENFLSKLLFKDFHYQVYDPVLDINYAFLKVIVSLINCVKYQKTTIFKAIFSYAYLKKLRRDFWAYLHSESIREIDPSLVLTWIDDSPIFHKCCKNIPEIHFIAIQNGARNLWSVTDALNLEEKYYIDDYFCFGEYVKDLMDKYNHNINMYHTVGSIKYGVIYDQYLKNNKTYHYDICFISQYKDVHFNDVDKLPLQWKNLGNNVVEITKMIGRYVNKNSLKICIALRYDKNSEKSFYKKYIGDNIIFSNVDRSKFNSYKVAIKSKVCVAINSTLTTELFGGGHKVLFVNPFCEEWLKPVNDGPWYCPGTNYNEFKKKLSYLLNVSNEEYLSLASSEMKYIMNFNPAELPHKLIRARIEEIVAKKEVENV